MATSKQQDDPQRQQPSSPSTAADPSARDGNEAGRGDGGQFADRIQGEGNYDAAREYDEAQREFVESGKVEEAARKAAPQSPAEEREMLDAEREGKSRAKSDE